MLLAVQITVLNYILLCMPAKFFLLIKILFSQTFNELLKPYMNEAEMMAMVAKSEEFEQVKVSISYLES